MWNPPIRQTKEEERYTTSAYRLRLVNFQIGDLQLPSTRNILCVPSTNSQVFKLFTRLFWPTEKAIIDEHWWESLNGPLTIHLSFFGQDDLASATWRVDGECLLKALLNIGRPNTFCIVCSICNGKSELDWGIVRAIRTVCAPKQTEPAERT